MQALEQFDKAKQEVAVLTGKLKDFVVTSQGARDKLFSDARDANRIRKLIDNKRLEMTEPYRTAKTNLIKEHKAEKTRLDGKILEIDSYAKFDIAAPLEKAIAIAKNSILGWDAEQARLKAEEEAKIEKQRLEVEAEAKRKEDEAKAKSGIAAKLALKKAEDEKQESLAVIEKKEESINTKQKGREVEVVTWELFDINAIPKEFLTVIIDKKKIQAAIDKGDRIIPGIKLSYKKELKFQ